jgi:adenine deaminase
MGFNLKEQIAVARGLKKADCVLKGGRVVNVFSGEIYTADVAIHQGLIAGLGNYDGKRSIDVSSKFVLPGFIDSHVHLESSLLTPTEFAKAALPHGTTAVVADPHEIANVLGKKGVRYFLDATARLPLDFYFMLPSCVPATRLETSGAKLAAADLIPFLKHKRVLGLAEMMNYPGVLSGEPDVLRKLQAFGHTVIDGHAPGLSGRDLAAYIGAGMSSDHECVSAEEAKEKVRLGMTVFIREGSAAKDLEALLPAITPANSRFFCFCTDDLQAKDLLQGGIDAVVQKAVRLGLEPVIAVQMATINPALHFGLKRTGAVLPGYAANIAVIDNLESFKVEKVFQNGKLVAVKGELTETVRRVSHAVVRNTVRTRSLKLDDIRLKAKSDKARVIELIPDQIETKQAILPVTTKHGYVSSDTGRDVLRLLVVERHKATGNIGFGLVKGFGLRSGALASTVAHDSHNIIVVGVDDRDILKASMEIKKMHGGLAVVNDGKVLASLPLPVAGLMSEKPAMAVAEKLAAVHEAAKQLGVTIEGPFSAMAFLALPVIPELKLTDKGLVDVIKFEIVDLFV